MSQAIVLSMHIGCFLWSMCTPCLLWYATLCCAVSSRRRGLFLRNRTNAQSLFKQSPDPSRARQCRVLSKEKQRTSNRQSVPSGTMIASPSCRSPRYRDPPSWLLRASSSSRESSGNAPPHAVSIMQSSESSLHSVTPSFRARRFRRSSRR